MSPSILGPWSRSGAAGSAEGQPAGSGHRNAPHRGQLGSPRADQVLSPRGFPSGASSVSRAGSAEPYDAVRPLRRHGDGEHARRARGDGGFDNYIDRRYYRTMEALTSEVAVILALGRGPSSGVGLTERLRAKPFDLRPFGPGTLYPLLRRLEKAGLVRCWVERGRARVGRPRHFQELTANGIVALGRARQQLRALGGAATTPAPRPSEVRRMRTDLRRSFRVSSFALRLRGAGAR